MLTTVATGLAALVGLAVVLMGARAFRAPEAAAGFGIPGTPTHDRAFQAWLRVKGARDAASGVILLVVAVAGGPHLLGWVLLAATLIPVADCLVVLQSGGPKPIAYGVHAATAAAMAVIAVLLLVG